MDKTGSLLTIIIGWYCYQTPTLWLTEKDKITWRTWKYVITRQKGIQQVYNKYKVTRNGLPFFMSSVYLKTITGGSINVFLSVSAYIYGKTSRTTITNFVLLCGITCKNAVYNSLWYNSFVLVFSKFENESTFKLSLFYIQWQKKNCPSEKIKLEQVLSVLQIFGHCFPQPCSFLLMLQHEQEFISSGWDF